MAEEAWSNEEGTPLPEADKVVIPWGWHIIVMPVEPPSKIGSIIIPGMVLDKEQYLAYVGQIVSLGPLAYKHEKYATMGMKPEDMPQRGQWWLFPQYHYHRIDYKGVKLLALNDDSFIGRIPDGVSPWDFKIER